MIEEDGTWRVTPPRQVMCFLASTSAENRRLFREVLWRVKLEPALYRWVRCFAAHDREVGCRWRKPAAGASLVRATLSVM